MKISQQLLAFLFLLALVVRKGLSLRCYECSSFKDKDKCWNPAEGKTRIVDCPSEATVCRKVEQSIYYDDDEHTRIYRQCGIEGPTGECKERTGTYKFKSWYCHCKNDLCNGQSKVALSFPVMLVALFGYFGLRYLL